MSTTKAKKHCDHCGASMVEYRHRLNKGLVSALAKLYRAGGAAHIREIGLTTSEFCNFQKLKHWGFVEKSNTEDQVRIGGSWSITREGANFLLGRITAPSIVWTYRDVAIRFESRYIFAKDVNPDFDTRDYYIDTAEAHK